MLLCQTLYSIPSSEYYTNIILTSYWPVLIPTSTFLTLSILCKLLNRWYIEILFFVSPENILYFMLIVSNLHEMSNHVSSENYEKYHQFVICWVSPENGKNQGWGQSKWTARIVLFNVFGMTWLGIKPTTPWTQSNKTLVWLGRESHPQPPRHKADSLPAEPLSQYGDISYTCTIFVNPKTMQATKYHLLNLRIERNSGPAFLDITTSIFNPFSNMMPSISSEKTNKNIAVLLVKPT